MSEPQVVKVSHEELLMELAKVKIQNEKLETELWQAKGELGHPVPGHIPCSTTLKCGLCEAKANALLK